jgi:hypothetical protein
VRYSEKISFWHSAWVQEGDLAPNLFTVWRKRNRSLQHALLGNKWISDLNLQHPGFSAQYLIKFIHLWRATRETHLLPDIPDSITWKFTGIGEYTTGSAYQA